MARKKGARAAPAKVAPKKKDDNSDDDDINNNNSNYEPLNGSWVAELEDAKGALAEALATKPPSPASGEAAAASEGTSKGKKGKDKEGGDFGGNTELPEAYLRVCRAHRMLRQWERLLESAKRGLAQCAATSSSQYEPELRKYKKQAETVLALPSGLKNTVYIAPRTFDRREDQVGPFNDLDRNNGLKTTFRDGLHQSLIVQGVVPDMFMDSETVFGNTNSFQDACFQGDVRLVEETISLGVAIDRPFRDVPPGSAILENKVVVPQKASALVMACVKLAVADSTCDRWAFARKGLPQRKEHIDKVEEIATQLVHLGADLNRKLVLEGQFNMVWNLRELHGKTAFQIASMSKRPALIELMAEHMRLGPEGRAEIVHCRCGSRLPWKMCHSTGVGQPPHYITKGGRVHYCTELRRCRGARAGSTPRCTTSAAGATTPSQRTWTTTRASTLARASTRPRGRRSVSSSAWTRATRPTPSF
jgi:hypothetical protein